MRPRARTLGLFWRNNDYRLPVDVIYLQLRIPKIYTKLYTVYNRGQKQSKLMFITKYTYFNFTDLLRYFLIPHKMSTRIPPGGGGYAYPSVKTTGLILQRLLALSQLDRAIGSR
jgi:hypothetical protein